MENMSIKALAEDFNLKSPLYTEQAELFPYEYSPGHPKVLMVAGANASGKSLYAVILQSFCTKKHETSPINISIRERSGGSSNEIGGMRRLFMFGDESEQSTGATSVSVVRAGFSNLNERAKEGKKPILLLDEPELGLSEGYSEAMGEFIADSVLKAEKGAVGVILISHSKPLAGKLAERLGEAPSFVYADPAKASAQGFKEWLSHREAFSMEDLLKLEELGLAGFRRVSAFTNRKN
jgi:hypothetical protein